MIRSPVFHSIRGWLVVLLFALSLVAWTNGVLIARHARLAELSRSESVVTPDAVTGYHGEIRERVLPDRDIQSYALIAQTQEMLAGGPKRVREVVDENAPFGRPSHAASPYRWWLGALSWCDHAVSGKPFGLAVQTAANLSDPLLHLLIVLGVSLFALRSVGPLGGSLAAVASASLFPFASRFLPGAPDDSSLYVICLLGSVLPLVSGIGKRDTNAARQSKFWFSVAAVFGGLGFWVNPSVQLLATLGIALGGAVAIMLRRSTDQDVVERPWRLWGSVGAGTILCAYLLEYFPRHLGDWELRAIHPLYAISWLGIAELLARAAECKTRGRAVIRPRFVGAVALAFAGVLAVPLAMVVNGSRGFLALDPLYYRLTLQPEGVSAQNIVEWIREYGVGFPLLATMFPLSLLIWAAGTALRSRSHPAAREALAISLAPALLFVGVACFQIRQWLLVDAALLSVLVATTYAQAQNAVSSRRRWVWISVVSVALLPGLLWQFPRATADQDPVMARSQAVGLVERDLAHWLTKRNPGDRAIVLAPPKVTTSLNYYGALRGVATLSWENQDGLAFAVRVAISTSRDEVAALLRSRGVKYIVLTSWDAFFEPYVQAASVQTGELFFGGLSRWNLPLWLKPIPYQLPSIAGFESQWVKVFEVGEDESAPVAASQLAEYFIEMGGQPENVRVAYQALLKYPADFGAQIARAEVWASLGEADNFVGVLEPLIERLSKGGDRYLPWERRVRFALVLAQGNRMDLAQLQITRCAEESDEARLRSLSPVSLYRFLSLNKRLGITFSDPKLQPLARSLLPEPMRPGL